MPFMRGREPIRKTLQFLQSGNLMFREKVNIFSVNYNTSGDHHHGARDFIFWFLPQVQYQNPSIQCITFKNMTPSPFIKIFCNDGEKILIDIDSRSKEEIRDHIKKFVAVCKTEEELRHEAIAKEIKDNPANFGYGCGRHCICEIPGQLPCPNLVPLPNHMRGKYKYAQN